MFRYEASKDGIHPLKGGVVRKALRGLSQYRRASATRVSQVLMKSLALLIRASLENDQELHKQGEGRSYRKAKLSEVNEKGKTYVHSC